jgi:aminoglycoside N3'-acetyltransferase
MPLPVTPSTAERPPLARAALVAQLRGLGVRAGGVLVVHSAFRAVRPVEAGPAGLIGALRDALGATGTLVMPTMTGSRRAEPYDPTRTPTRHMGVVAETFWRLPGVRRSDHPTSSFAAAGPAAPAITAPQPAEPVHGPDSPIGGVWALDGWVLLLGVGHPADTTVHLGECLAGVPYRRRKWATVLAGGQPRRIDFAEPDHCCRQFARVDAWLRAAKRQREGTVGSAPARWRGRATSCGSSPSTSARTGCASCAPPAPGAPRATTRGGASGPERRRPVARRRQRAAAGRRGQRCRCHPWVVPVPPAVAPPAIRSARVAHGRAARTGRPARWACSASQRP